MNKVIFPVYLLAERRVFSIEEVVEWSGKVTLDEMRRKAVPRNGRSGLTLAYLYGEQLGYEEADRRLTQEPLLFCAAEEILATAVLDWLPYCLAKDGANYFGVRMQDGSTSILKMRLLGSRWVVGPVSGVDFYHGTTRKDRLFIGAR